MGKEEAGIAETLSRLHLNPAPGETPADVAHRVADAVRVEHDSDSEGEGEDDGSDEDLLGAGGSPFPEDNRPPRMAPVDIPPPAARGGRPRSKDTPKGKLSKWLLDKMPGAERVMVHKRVEGQRWFIKEFSKDDMEGFPTMEAFLVRFVQPKYKDGEYDLTGLDAMNRQTPLGTVRLLADPSATSTPEQGALSLVEKVLAEQRDRERERNNAPPQNPLEMLAGLMSLRKELDGDSKEKVKEMEEAVQAAKSDTMTMMMAMMQQGQQQAQQQMQMMLAVLNKPKEPDPMMQLLIAKLFDDGGSRGGALPPPAPPPAGNSMTEMLTAMAAFMSTMGGGPPPDDDYKTLLRELLLQKNAQPGGGLGGLKEMVEVVQLLKGGGEGETGNKFQSAVDNMAAVMNLAQNMRRETEPGAAAGFFDMMSALFGNRDFAGSLAQAIRSKTDTKTGSEEQRLLAIKQRLELEARILEKKRQELIALANGQQQPQLPQAVAQPNGGAPPSQPVTRAVQEEADRKVAKTRTLPELPDNTYEHVNNILEAKDEGDTVGKVIGMVIYFAGFDQWRGFMEHVLGNVRDGNKQKALEYFNAFFEGLVGLNMLSIDAAKGVIVLLDQHFDVVRSQISDLLLEKDKAPHDVREGIVTGGSPDAGGAPAVAAP